MWSSGKNGLANIKRDHRDGDDWLRRDLSHATPCNDGGTIAQRSVDANRCHFNVHHCRSDQQRRRNSIPPRNRSNRRRRHLDPGLWSHGFRIGSKHALERHNKALGEAEKKISLPQVSFLRFLLPRTDITKIFRRVLIVPTTEVAILVRVAETRQHPAASVGTEAKSNCPTLLRLAGGRLWGRPVHYCS